MHILDYCDSLIFPVHKQACDVSLDIFASICDENKATYVSMPMTTGKDFVDWYYSSGKLLHMKEYSEKHREEILLPNIAKAIPIISELREKEKENGQLLVISPEKIMNHDWTQDDYLYFWGSVIEKFANKVIFLDEWQYSKGCCFEYLIAIENNINTYQQDRNVLTIKEVFTLMNAAMKEMFDKDIDISFHEKIKEAIVPI